jgi:hypothetical protein
MLSIAALLKVFQARALFVFDPAAMQSILVKDQNIYEEHKDIISSVISTLLHRNPPDCLPQAELACVWPMHTLH